MSDMLHNTTRKSKAQKIADLRILISDLSGTGRIAFAVTGDLMKMQIGPYTIQSAILNLKS
jgi:hypothetical protein